MMMPKFRQKPRLRPKPAQAKPSLDGAAWPGILRSQSHQMRAKARAFRPSQSRNITRLLLLVAAFGFWSVDEDEGPVLLQFGSSEKALALSVTWEEQRREVLSVSFSLTRYGPKYGSPRDTSMHFFLFPSPPSPPHPLTQSPSPHPVTHRTPLTPTPSCRSAVKHSNAANDVTHILVLTILSGYDQCFADLDASRGARCGRRRAGRGWWMDLGMLDKDVLCALRRPYIDFTTLACWAWWCSRAGDPLCCRGKETTVIIPRVVKLLHEATVSVSSALRSASSFVNVDLAVLRVAGWSDPYPIVLSRASVLRRTGVEGLGAAGLKRRCRCRLGSTRVLVVKVLHCNDGRSGSVTAQGRVYTGTGQWEDASVLRAGEGDEPEEEGDHWVVLQQPSLRFVDVMHGTDLASVAVSSRRVMRHTIFLSSLSMCIWIARVLDNGRCAGAGRHATNLLVLRLMSPADPIPEHGQFVPAELKVKTSTEFLSILCRFSLIVPATRSDGLHDQVIVESGIITAALLSNYGLILYSTIPIIDSHSEQGVLVTLSPAMDTSVSSIQVFQCSQPLVSQIAVVDSQTQQIHTVEPDFTKTASKWMPYTGETLEASVMFPNMTGNALIDLWELWYINIPSSSYYLDFTGPSDDLASVADIYLIQKLNLPAANHSDTQNITLHDLENALSTLVASMFWTMGHIHPAYGVLLDNGTVFPNGTISQSLNDVSTAPMLLPGNATVTELVPETQLELSIIAVSAGLVVSIVLIAVVLPLLRQSKFDGDLIRENLLPEFTSNSRKFGSCFGNEGNETKFRKSGVIYPRLSSKSAFGDHGLTLFGKSASTPRPLCIELTISPMCDLTLNTLRPFTLLALVLFVLSTSGAVKLSHIIKAPKYHQAQHLVHFQSLVRRRTLKLTCTVKPYTVKSAVKPLHLQILKPLHAVKLRTVNAPAACRCQVVARDWFLSGRCGGVDETGKLQKMCEGKARKRVIDPIMVFRPNYHEFGENVGILVWEDGTGILHTIWLYRNHPELGRMLEQVEHPTDENLRAAGMVRTRLVANLEDVRGEDL
ncbi:hypothetical protein B0H12DRAFT_1291944 [Mycena haematopus]|nr:hypothetical protein B0H12DRAFT_1291944 [Mycena haematopus]